MIAKIRIPSHHNENLPILMSGANQNGETIAANQRFLTINEKPWLPVMGEFHFSRYPQKGWREELLKMKAGGIDIAATYIFWIHIEESENQFNWQGNNDFRRFVQTCGDVGLYAYPRIGPWAHGECRNGGFPNWLLDACGNQVRTDAPLYLSYVRRFFEQIATQLSGLLWKEGGPVIGIQVENELRQNGDHIRTLREIAREVGLDVPLYTMTGWGGAEVPDRNIIPVFGGYPDAFWDRQVNSWSRNARKHYFFSRLRDDNFIGNDLQNISGDGRMEVLEAFPYGTCETGGGMQVSYHRRPFIDPDDIASLALVKVGNGSNLQGYYMYHGGTNPMGKFSTMQESQATNYPNDLPIFDYDFQAPLGEYGQVRASYHRLRPLHLFLQDFGSRLAPLPMTLPFEQPKNLDDRNTLRWAARSDGNTGFVFVNNHQRVESTFAQENVQFHLLLPSGSLTIPSRPVSIKSGAYFFWPFHFDLDGVQLKYATAQPICRFQAGDHPLYVFFSEEGIDAEFAFDRATLNRVDAETNELDGDDLLVITLQPGTNNILTIERIDQKEVQILLLSKSQARMLWKKSIWGKERLFLSGDNLMFDDSTLIVQADGQQTISFAVYPPPEKSLTCNDQTITGAPEGIFSRYDIPINLPYCTIESTQTQKAGPSRPTAIGPQQVAQAPGNDAYNQSEVWHLRFSQYAFDSTHELILEVNYVGDAARAYINGKIVEDDFYNGRLWELGLSRFAPEVFTHGLELRFLPLRKDSPIYLPEKLNLREGEKEEILAVNAFSLRPVVQVEIRERLIK